jgi:hypothetical protein
VLGALALKILLQLAVQDIGQLTDIEPRLLSCGHSPALVAQFRPGGDSAPTAWSV